MRRIIYILLCLVGIFPFISAEARAQSSKDVRRLLRRLEENSDRFAISLNYALDHSSLNGSRTEDEINAYVHDFEEATDRLKKHYDHRGSDPDSAREVLLRARAIDCFMRRRNLGPRATGDWQVVRADLDAWERNYEFAGAGGLDAQIYDNNGRPVSWRSGNHCGEQTDIGARSSTNCVQQTATVGGRNPTNHVNRPRRVRVAKKRCKCSTVAKSSGSH